MSSVLPSPIGFRERTHHDTRNRILALSMNPLGVQRHDSADIVRVFVS